MSVVTARDMELLHLKFFPNAEGTFEYLRGMSVGDNDYFSFHDLISVVTGHTPSGTRTIYRRLVDDESGYKDEVEKLVKFLQFPGGVVH